jgi:hypothetical protein
MTTCLCVRPRTSAAILSQFLPPCVCTAFLSLMSSSSAHLPVRPGVRSMLGSKTRCHLCRHCVSARPGTSAATAPQFLPLCVCTASFSFRLRLLPIYPYIQVSDRFWDPRRDATGAGTAFPLDPEPARQLLSNSCNRAFVLHPLALCRLLPICPYAQVSDRCWDPRHDAIYYTVISFDPESARLRQPNLFCTSCRTSSHRYSSLHSLLFRLLLASSDPSPVYPSRDLHLHQHQQ